jgi:EAL domain-containing protein (putative c-di-GMP-specific phosphodiesterase class I)
VETSKRLFMDNDETNPTVLQQLKQRGVRIAISQLGAGPSFLAYLKHFSADTLKIGRMFVKGLPGNRHDATIASAMIGIAHGPGHGHHRGRHQA